MTPEKIIEHSNRLAEIAQNIGNDLAAYRGIHAQVCEFLRTYGKPNNSFYNSAIKQVSGSTSYLSLNLAEILRGFSSYIKEGLLEEVRPERQAQLDVVSDLLEQAQLLLEDGKVHAAAPTVLIGATLEEFLRTWIEDEGLSLGNKKASLSNYATLLRENELISKQDVKDITSWGGIRNSAAHGEWDEVSDSKRIKLMLEGVNLFMRKYGK